MTDTTEVILDILKTLSAIVPFLLLCLVSNKVNLKRQIRDRQYLMPVFTVIYVIAAMIFLKNINDQLLSLLRQIPLWIDGLLAMLPENFAQAAKTPADAVKNLLASLNLEYWVFYLSNTVIAAVYLAYKAIILGILKSVHKKERALHSRIAGAFYAYFPEKDVWCLREDYVQARTFAKAIYFTLVVTMALLMLVSGRLYAHGLLADVLYPVFSVLPVGEIFFFLDGASRSEYLRDILGEDEDAYKIVNYSLLRKYLRNLFGDKLLSENTNVNIALANDVTNNEVIEDLLSDPDPKVVAFATYYDKLNRAGFELDHNYLNSSLDLLNGKSILFNNPFYRDLIPYAFYPMNRMLLSGKKVLVVLGRHSIEDDVKTWLEDGVESVTNIPFLWRTGVLSENPQELDIGILTRSNVISIGVHNANRQFLEEVGFVVILEPSKLITTAQIGLNLLVKSFRRDEGQNAVFCLCDKNCDGLIDAMSHILMTNLTEVSATEKHRGTSSYMCWDADNDFIHHRQIPNISRYLGVGTELSFAALKNQVSQTHWYGGDAFPVTDMSWIARQYYYDLMKYADLPTTQEAVGDYFKTTPNFWSAEISKNNYFTVEDEACNMFEILRDFSTRSTEQGFINVISSTYLLKDYMAANNTIFEADAKAIPCIVADFARTKRNIVLELILLMSQAWLPEKRIRKEFSLAGLPQLETERQLWYEIYRALSPASIAAALPQNYTEAVNAVYRERLSLPNGNSLSREAVLRLEERYNLEEGELQLCFRIIDEQFIQSFIAGLKSASYISEDEKGERYYLGAELCDHIYQKHLPGQFFTYSGKYYEMLYTTFDGQVLVRRASDHIEGRPSYRQIRKYAISDVKESDHIGAIRDIDGVRLTDLYADFAVSTEGYYRMNRYNDFASAKRVVFEGEKSRIPNRIYLNKRILRIDLPSSGGALTNEIRYTITLLMNELFRTLFAENAPYIAALTDVSHVPADANVSPLTYSLETLFDGGAKDCIYIVEDSDLDLGLLIAVERNLTRIFRMIEDYLSWNKGAIVFSMKPSKAEEPVAIDPSKNDFELGKEEEPGFFRRIGRAKKFFDRKEQPQKPMPEPQPLPENTAADETVHRPSSHAEAKRGSDFTRDPYHKRYYLLYGGEGEPDVIDSNGTLDYIKSLALGGNPLKEARRGRRISRLVEAAFQPNRRNARYCDFCGKEIYGVEYETLADGRDRCISCSRTAIKTEAEFIRIFEDVKRNMESFFGIKINAGIRVQMVNAAKLNKSLGQSFVPSSGYDGRALGVAVNKHGSFTLMVENGSPRMMSILTMAHELTHIWQYLNWNAKDIRRKYGDALTLQIYEGMAKWVEVQYAYLINEAGTAKREELITMSRGDAYSFGYIRYKANYPITADTVITRDTPFMNPELPLNPLYCGSDVSAMRIEDNSGRYDESPDDDDDCDFFEDDPQPPAPERPSGNGVILRNPDKAPFPMSGTTDSAPSDSFSH